MTNTELENRPGVEASEGTSGGSLWERKELLKPWHWKAVT